jgi:hypothetical protein
MGRAWVAAANPGEGEAGGRLMEPGVTHINGGYGPPVSRQIQDNKMICLIFRRLTFSTTIVAIFYFEKCPFTYKEMNMDHLRT